MASMPTFDILWWLRQNAVLTAACARLVPEACRLPVGWATSPAAATLALAGGDAAPPPRGSR